MRRIPLLAVCAVSAPLAAGLFTAAPALAAAPAPAQTATFCPPGATTLPNGQVEFGIEADGAGCVIIAGDTSGVTLVQVVDAPGWTDQVKAGGELSGQKFVDVRFTQTATGARHEVRTEVGKTKVK